MKLIKALGATSTRSSSLTEYLNWISQTNGLGSPLLSLTETLGSKQEEIDPTFSGYVNQIFKANPVVFGCMAARSALFCEARFKYRRLVNGRPGELFGLPSLKLLEEPWPEASTSDLLKRMIMDGDLMGNFFGAELPGGRIMRMRPDWVSIVLGSRADPGAEVGFGDLGIEAVGYIYQPGGYSGGGDPVLLMADEVAHFAPTPDPLFAFRGMSWLTPILREVMGDQAGTDHKLKYLEKGAVPNAVVQAGDKVSPEAFQKFRELFEKSRKGDPYGPLFLGGGADYTVIGNDMRKIDFKAIQALGENRICVAARVPSIIAGVSEGLASATYSNTQQSKRLFSDATMSPLWSDACAALAPLVKVPYGSELWYDTRDIPYLREDVKDEAEAQRLQAETVNKLVEAGFEPDSVVAAVTANDMARLVHTGLVSVQLQEPGSGEEQSSEPSSNGSGSPAVVPAP
jgi:hypothetical protein